MKKEVKKTDCQRNESQEECNCSPVNEIRFSTELAGNIFGSDYLKCDGSFVLKADYPLLLLPVVDGQMQLPDIPNAWIRASLPIEVISITESGIWTVPAKVTNVDIFAVGGGGGGGGDAYQSDTSGNGGNGGQVVIESLSVTAGEDIAITIGNGGIGGSSANNYSTATNGGNTIFKDIIVQGGYKGYSRQEAGGSPVQPTQTGCTTGGNGSIYGSWNGEAGQDGVVCPFPGIEGKFGASGGGGGNPYRGYTSMAPGGQCGGGNGGGGNNNTQENKGADGEFYGAAGGGGGFSSSHSYSQGGNGYKGIILIKYSREE